MTALSIAAPASPADAAPFSDTRGPRYTSYPTADRFVEAFGPDEYLHALHARAKGTGVGGRPPLGLYVHVPFCASLCWYCACNKVVTRHGAHADAWLDDLAREVALVAAALGARERVAHLHLGGGTPTFLADAQLARLMAIVREGFQVPAEAALSIEVDPRTVDAGRVARLVAAGFRRLSFGVQDLDPAVQRAVHRVQPAAQVASLVDAARAAGARSINLDLIHGLPLQTPAAFARTLDQVIGWRPDRVALYAYAHLPERFRPQRRIDAALLPDGPARAALLADARARFAAAGYEDIGMDHFALPGDALAVARREGRLQRDFQGYTTHADGDLVGLGVSAIGRVGAVYAQNAKTLDEYHAALAHGRLPTARGLALTREDLLRRAVIMALMCQGRLEFESVESAWLIDVHVHFARELEALRSFAAHGLVELEPRAVQLTPRGWSAVRAVAMVFDRHLQADAERARFARLD